MAYNYCNHFIPKVHAAIRQCKEAGITVRMVTKENIITAKSVALKCGILDPRDKHYIYTGRDFNDYIKDPDGAVSAKFLFELFIHFYVTTPCLDNKLNQSSTNTFYLCFSSILFYLCVLFVYFWGIEVCMWGGGVKSRSRNETGTQWSYI